jgi:hypothetical protein
MEDVVVELEISGRTSISTFPSSTSLNDGMGLYSCSLNALSPVADWGHFCSDDVSG